MDLTFYKKIKFPIIFLTKLSEKIKENLNIINDEKLFYLIKFFFKFNHFYLIDLKLCKLFNSIINSHPKSFKFINSHDILLNLTVSNFRKLFDYRDRVGYKFIDKDIEYQISFWEDKIKILNAINDCSFSNDSFIIKLMTLNTDNIHYTKEIINRLILIKKLLGNKFFKKNKIILFTLEDFNNLDYQNKVKLFMKFFIKCKHIINTDIYILKETKNYWDLLKFMYRF